LRQDERGRWVSDNGRYLWDGSEWVDLVASGPPETPEAGAVGQPSAPGPQQVARSHPASPPRRRPWLLLLGLVLLVAVGTGAVLLFSHRSSPTPRSSAPTPSVGDAVAGGLSPSPATPAVLDESQRRDRAEAALLHRTDLPGTTEERPASPTDVFLPCRAPGLTPPPGSVLVGQTVSNSDFTVYVGETIAGFPSARQAADALAQARSTISHCAPYDYRYANSPRTDHITFTDVAQPIALGDGGVYLAEVDTPANYVGTPTTYSYGYVQHGQFLVRLTLTNNSQADRPGLELLVRKTLVKLG
jgi:hypothetical protein